MSESICDVEAVIACCGNPLYGDNGFATCLVPVLKQTLNGAKRLKVVDVGRGYFLFGILECKKLVLVDSIDFGGAPGELKKLSIDDVDENRYADHQCWQTSTPLNDLKERCDVTIIACQPKSWKQIEFGLTEEVSGSIPIAMELIQKEVEDFYEPVLEEREEI
ncbi:MAG: hydrogenase maturation protease [Halobacteriota archaeon]